MLCSCQTKQVKKAPILPLEQSDYRKLTTNAEMVAYLEMVSNFSEMINIEILDSTISGKRIPLIWLGTKGEKNNSKPSLLFFAQQHGNEPSGKEGLLLLINEFALGRHLDLLENVNLFIIPQTNPDGGDKNERRNSDGIDLNRDHLLFQSKEVRLVQKVFDEYLPEVIVDIHEYYPYSEEWDKFGYSRNIDIQFGGPTNINIDSGIQTFFYTTAFPEVKQQVEKDGYSFFEYTLGYLPEGERLRRSTVDINDGRQSLGITNTIAFIIEGKRGRDSLDLLERRAKSQMSTCLAILKMVAKHNKEIKKMVNDARGSLKQESEQPVSIRMDHFKGNIPLKYPLISIKTGKDSVFVVEEYHSLVKSILDVKPPKGYLIPKKDTLLCNWLKRSFFKYGTELPATYDVWQYKIIKLNMSVDEELGNWYAQVEKQKHETDFDPAKFYYIPVNQIYKYKIITALEPQAMYGIVNYKDFEYLLQNKYFPVLRLE